MSIKKHGVVVGCEGCRYMAEQLQDGFDVSVPLSDEESGTEGTARLHCSVSATEHRVELGEWQDEQGETVKPLPEVEQRVRAALDFVAERRLCGNRELCPYEVVDIVAEKSER